MIAPETGASTVTKGTQFGASCPQKTAQTLSFTPFPADTKADRETLKIEVKRACTLDLVARYIESKTGEKVTRSRPGECWIGNKQGKGSLHLTQTPDGVLAHDFAGNAQGDVFKVIEAFEGVSAFPEQLEIAAELCGISLDRESRTPRRAPVAGAQMASKAPEAAKPDLARVKRLEAFWSEYSAELRDNLHLPECVQMLTARGFELLDVMLFDCIGYTPSQLKVPTLTTIEAGSFVFVDLKRGALKAIKCDRNTGKRVEGGIVQVKGSNLALRPNESQAHTSRDLYFVEGEFDAVALSICGFDAIAYKPTNKTPHEIAELLTGKDRVLLAYDNDEAGDKLTQAMLKIRPDALDVRGAFAGINDPNDWIKGHNVADLQAEMQRAIETATAEGAKRRAAANAELRFIEAKKALVANLPTDAVTKKGLITHSINTYMAVLDSPELIGGRYQFDTLSKRVYFVELDGAKREVNCDNESIDLMCKLQNKCDFASATKCDALRNCLIRSAKKHPFDTMRQLIDALPKWDGVKRIERFFIDYAGADDSQFVRKAGLYTWFALYGRAYGLDDKGAPDRALSEPGTATEGFKADASLVLLGAQNIGKSTFVKTIALDKGTTGVLTFGGDMDEITRQIQGKNVIEVAEMAGMKNKEVTDLKSFLSKSVDSYRPLYKNEYVEAPRRSLFFMTGNEPEYLRDTTGNRRYVSIECKGRPEWAKPGVKVPCLNIDGLRADREQLWAEAKETFDAGLFSQINGELTTLLQEVNAAHMERRGIDDVVEEAACSFGAQRFSTQDIYKKCPEGTFRAFADSDRLIAESLKRIGCVKVHTRTGNRWENPNEKADIEHEWGGVQ